MRNLDSDINEAAKVNFINIIKESVTDPVLMSKQLPDLYNNLLDPISINIRVAAMKMLDSIVNQYPQVITEILLDLIDLFSFDTSPVTKANAMMILGTIAERMPERLTASHIGNIIMSLTDRCEYIQQKTVTLIDSIAPFINNQQRDEIFKSLIVLERAYATSKKLDFCAKVVWQLADLSKSFPRAYRWVVRNHIVKYCNIEDDSIRKDFFKHLTLINSKHPEFEEDWLKQAIIMLNKTRASMYDNRNRSSIFSNMYTISTEVIRNNVSLFDGLMNCRDAVQDAFDIINILSILAWSELHEQVIGLAEK